MANTNAQRWPIDTINGLQYFMGKPLNMRIYREKAHAHTGIGQADEQQWRQELRALTEAIGLARNDVTGRLVSNQGQCQGPPPPTSDYAAPVRKGAGKRGVGCGGRRDAGYGGRVDGRDRRSGSICRIGGRSGSVTARASVRGRHDGLSDVGRAGGSHTAREHSQDGGDADDISWTPFF